MDRRRREHAAHRQAAGARRRRSVSRPVGVLRPARYAGGDGTGPAESPRRTGTAEHRTGCANQRTRAQNAEPVAQNAEPDAEGFYSIGGNIPPPAPTTESVPAVRSREADAAGVTGAVILEIRVDENGGVSDARVLQLDPDAGRGGSGDRQAMALRAHARRGPSRAGEDDGRRQLPAAAEISRCMGPASAVSTWSIWPKRFTLHVSTTGPSRALLPQNGRIPAGRSLASASTRLHGLYPSIPAMAA